MAARLGAVPSVRCDEVPAPPAELAPGGGALAHGQRYSLRELETYPEAGLGEANLPLTLDVRGRSEAEVRRALAIVAARHESLRIGYLDAGGVRPAGGGAPWRQQAIHAPLPLRVVERDLRGPADCELATARLLTEPIPIGEPPYWRAELATRQGRPVALSLSLSHLIVDVWAVRELTGQLAVALTDPDRAAPAALGPRGLAAQERADAARTGPATDRHWRALLDGDRGYPWPVVPARAAASRIQLTLSSYALGGLADAAGRRNGCTAPSVLLAALLAALSGTLGHRRPGLAVMAGNRFRPEHRHCVGTLNQLVPVLVDVDPALPLGAHLSAVHWAGARAYRHARYDVDQVTGLAGGGPDAFGRVFPAWFNYLPLDGTTAAADDRRPAVFAWTERARPFGQTFDARVTVAGGCTALAVRTDPALIPAEALAALLTRTAAVVAAAATGRPVTVAEAAHGPLPRLPRSIRPDRVPDPPG